MAAVSLPKSLIVNGRLSCHIYKTAETTDDFLKCLVTGKTRDLFPPVHRDPPRNTVGTIAHCDLSALQGNTPSNEQWDTLSEWHAGLSCQSLLRHRQSILFDVDDEDFEALFDDVLDKPDIEISENVTYRIFVVYSLIKDTAIPASIGIESDGDSHVCIYPTATPFAVSDVTRSGSRFTINALADIKQEWKRYAALRFQASGFSWPSNFPPDSDLFPFKQWVTTVITYGDCEIAVEVSNSCRQFTVEKKLDVYDFLSRMVHIATQFSLDCDFNSFHMNSCLLKELLFALGKLDALSNSSTNRCDFLFGVHFAQQIHALIISLFLS
jgi:hypothetical protein